MRIRRSRAAEGECLQRRGLEVAAVVAAEVVEVAVVVVVVEGMARERRERESDWEGE